MKTKLLARECVRAIEKDIRGRMGLGNEWDAMNIDIRHEIEDEWEKIVGAIINKAIKEVMDDFSPG